MQRIDVPPGVSSVNVDFTVLLNHPNNFVDGHLATNKIMVGNWNRYLLYQRNIDNTQYFVRASLILPACRAGDAASPSGRGGRTVARSHHATRCLECLSQFDRIPHRVRYEEATGAGRTGLGDRA